MAAVGIDGDHAFRARDRLMADRRAHGRRVGGAGPLDRLRPEANGPVSGHGLLRRGPFVSGARGERADECLVGSQILALERARDDVVKRDVIAGHGLKFVLADGEHHHGKVSGADPGLTELAEQRGSRIAAEEAEHDVGVRGADRLDGRRHVEAPGRQIFLPDERGTDAGELVSEKCSRRSRPWIVGADQKEAAGRHRFLAPRHGRSDLLVRQRADRDDVRRFLEALVAVRVDEEVVVRLGDRHHGAPARRRPASDDDVDPVVANEPFRLPGEGVAVGPAVGDHPADLSPQQPPGPVDVLEGHHLGVDEGAFLGGRRTGSRVEDPHDDRLAFAQPLADPPSAEGGQREGAEDPRPVGLPGRREGRSAEQGVRWIGLPSEHGGRGRVR